MHTSHHRPEIDGLRSLAVIPVILFHLSPSLLPNGFLGVDVFFVISGYLITGILLRSLSAGNFSLLGFWGRRVQRLFPALATTLLVSLLAGWFVLFGPEWKSLGYQSLATLTSTANIFYWRAAGDYWGQTAESMPLLHMWSLAVEEQFYLIYPLVLMTATKRLSRRALGWLLLAGVICSLGLMAIGMAKFRAAAFYLLPCRMWELLAGGWLASLDPPKVARARASGSAAGLLLLAATYLVPISHGHLRLLGCLSAVLATGLVLRYAQSNSITTRCLTIAPLLWIGRISYSLYLWHWPAIVLGPLFLKISSAGTACVIIGLSWFSWAFIEQRTRYLDSHKFWKVFALQLGLVILSLSLPFYAQRPTLRFSPPADNAAANVQPPCVANVDGWTGTWETGLTLGNLNDPDARSIVLLGDSHGVMYFSPVKEAAEAVGLTLTSFAADGGTAPFFVPVGAPTTGYGLGWEADDRRRFDVVRREFIVKNRPRLVVLTGRWAAYLWLHGARGLDQHFRTLLASIPAETRVIILGQPPELPFGSGGFQDGELSIPPLRAFFEDSEVRDRRITAHQIIKRLAASNSKVKFVDVQSIFETSSGIRFLEGDIIYYKDDDHLSVAGAALCNGVIEEAIREAALSNI